MNNVNQQQWAVQLIRRSFDSTDSETLWVEYYTDHNQARDRAKSVTDYSNKNCVLIGEIRRVNVVKTATVSDH